MMRAAAGVSGLAALCCRGCDVVWSCNAGVAANTLGLFGASPPASQDRRGVLAKLQGVSIPDRMMALQARVHAGR